MKQTKVVVHYMLRDTCITMKSEFVRLCVLDNQSKSPRITVRCASIVNDIHMEPYQSGIKCPEGLSTGPTLIQTIHFRTL